MVIPLESGAGAEFTPENLLMAVLVLAAAYVIARLISLFLSGLANHLVEHRFRVTMLIPVLKFVVYASSLYLVMAFLFELTTTHLVAFAGLLGVALGLGLKDLLADIVGGLIVVLEQPFQVGDKVTLGGHYGEVTDIGIRSTRIVTPADTAVAVPNFKLLNEPVPNANTGDAEMLVVVEFYVDPEADVERAVEILEDALATSRYVYVSEEMPYWVVVEDDLYYRTLRGKAYVTDLRQEERFKTDVSERVLAAFDDEGIESPTVPAGVGEGAGGSSGS